MTQDERDQAEMIGKGLLLAIGLAYRAMSPRQRMLANHIEELARMLKTPLRTVVLSDKQTAEFNSNGQANAIVAKPLDRYADVTVVNPEMASLGTARVISCSQHYGQYLGPVK